MKNKLLSSLLIGSIVASVIFASCNKDEATPDNPDYSQPEGVFKDNRDNKEYKWVKIGNQIWMAENLAFKVDTGGCWAYEDNENYVKTYGYLYNWRTAKAAAPNGWHLPSKEEWTQLFDYLIENGYSYDGVVGNEGIAKSLATDNGWNISDNQGAIGNSDYPDFQNKSYFSALPGGNYTTYSYASMGHYGSWWSSTVGEYSEDEAYRITLISDRSNCETRVSVNWIGVSVRYIKD